MASDSQAPGLRERKKIKTREAIRREALRLFETKGYAGTTVEQIAQAADVSPSTFFRYFSNKAALLIPDQLMEPIIEAFLKAPPELSPVAAYRSAVEQTFNNMAGVEWAPEMARQRLLYTLPEAQGALYSEYIHTIELITQALALRLSRSAERHRTAHDRRRHHRSPDDRPARHADGACRDLSRVGFPGRGTTAHRRGQMAKSVFITGAAAGIGRETALTFAAKGYTVGAYDIDDTGLATLADRIRNAGGTCSPATSTSPTTTKCTSG